MRTSRKPQRATVLTTYESVLEYVQAWVRGQLNLLILLGPPGTAKSRMTKDSLAKRGLDACVIEGNATAFRLHAKLYCYQKECESLGKQPLVVIDDVDSLCADKRSVRQLKCLCQTDDNKRMMWETDAPTLDREGIPREYTTTARVAIIANEWRTLNVNVAAIEDRGHVVVFEPTPEEVYRASASWFWDQDVFDFVWGNLGSLTELSMRDLRLAWELKTAGLDWQRQLYDRWQLDPTLLSVMQLRDDPVYTTEADRVAAFVAATGRSKSTYYNVLGRLPCPPQTEPLLLHSPPPRINRGQSSIADDLLAAGRRQVTDRWKSGTRNRQN